MYLRNKFFIRTMVIMFICLMAIFAFEEVKTAKQVNAIQDLTKVCKSWTPPVSKKDKDGWESPVPDWMKSPLVCENLKSRYVTYDELPESERNTNLTKDPGIAQTKIQYLLYEIQERYESRTERYGLLIIAFVLFSFIPLVWYFFLNRLADISNAIRGNRK